jgi:hypothetical protein
MGYEAVSLATIRKNIWNTVATFVNTNKSTGWTVLSAFPEQNPVFPCIVISPASVSFGVLGLTKSIILSDAEIQLEFYSPASAGKKSIDTEKDKISYSFLTGFSTLKTYNLVLDGDSPLVDGPDDELSFNGQNFNYGSIIVRLKDP